MRYRVPRHVAWVRHDDSAAEAGVYAVAVDEAVPLVLQGTAELIWLVAEQGGDLPGDVDVPDGADPAEVRRQVVEFAARLVSLRLLEEDP